MLTSKHSRELQNYQLNGTEVSLLEITPTLIRTQTGVMQSQISDHEIKFLIQPFFFLVCSLQLNVANGHSY